MSENRIARIGLPDPRTCAFRDKGDISHRAHGGHRWVIVPSQSARPISSGDMGTRLMLDRLRGRPRRSWPRRLSVPRI